MTNAILKILCSESEKQTEWIMLNSTKWYGDQLYDNFCVLMTSPHHTVVWRRIIRA